MNYSYGYGLLTTPTSWLDHSKSGETGPVRPSKDEGKCIEEHLFARLAVKVEDDLEILLKLMTKNNNS